MALVHNINIKNAWLSMVKHDIRLRTLVSTNTDSPQYPREQAEIESLKNNLEPQKEPRLRVLSRCVSETRSVADYISKLDCACWTLLDLASSKEASSVLKIESERQRRSRRPKTALWPMWYTKRSNKLSGNRGSREFRRIRGCTLEGIQYEKLNSA